MHMTHWKRYDHAVLKGPTQRPNGSPFQLAQLKSTKTEVSLLRNVFLCVTVFQKHEPNSPQFWSHSLIWMWRICWGLQLCTPPTSLKSEQDSLRLFQKVIKIEHVKNRTTLRLLITSYTSLMSPCHEIYISKNIFIVHTLLVSWTCVYVCVKTGLLLSLPATPVEFRLL